MGTVAALATTGAAPAIASARNAPAPHGYRGRLVSVTPLRTLLDKAAVKAELTADGFAATSVRYGVRTYRLVYRTVSATGQPTTASGLLAVPISGARRLTVVSFTHGTEVYRGAAPCGFPGFACWSPPPMRRWPGSSWLTPATTLRKPQRAPPARPLPRPGLPPSSRIRPEQEPRRRRPAGDLPALTAW